MGHFPWLSQITRGYVIRKCNSSNVADIFIITAQATHLSVLLDIIEKVGTHHIPSLPIPIVLYPSVSCIPRALSPQLVASGWNSPNIDGTAFRTSRML